MTNTESVRTDNAGTDLPRRSVIKAAAWSVPVVASAVAIPAAAATTVTPPREFTIESNFGAGYYPTTQNSSSHGSYQFDCAYNDKYFRVLGTQAGDVIKDIYIEVLITTNWPVMTLGTLPGANPSWTTLAATGAQATNKNGQLCNVYRSYYVGEVQGTDGVTLIPIGFYFRSADMPYYPGATNQTGRYLTVNSQPVSIVRNPASIQNTNVALSNAPRP